MNLLFNTLDNGDEYRIVDDVLTVFEGVKVIPNRQFRDLKGVSTVILPSTLKVIGYNAFENANITSCIFNNGLEVINSFAFYNSSIMEAIIPNTVYSIGKSAFFGCSMLRKIVFPEELKVIPGDVVSLCSNLNNIVFPKKTTIICSEAISRTYVEEVVLESNPIYIGQKAFYYNHTLKSVDLSNCDNEYEPNFCENNNLLKSYHFKKKNKNVKFNNKNYSLIDGHLTIFEGVEKIPDEYFKDKNISSISFPSTLKTIGQKAFFSCPLTKLELPDSLEYIMSGAFEQCDNLTIIIFGNNLKVIGDNAFSDTNISKLNLPSSIVYLGKCNRILPNVNLLPENLLVLRMGRMSGEIDLKLIPKECLIDSLDFIREYDYEENISLKSIYGIDDKSIRRNVKSLEDKMRNIKKRGLSITSEHCSELLYTLISLCTISGYNYDTRNAFINTIRELIIDKSVITTDIINFCISSKLIDIAILLMSYGIDINNVDSNGETILNMAVMNKDKTLIKLLLEMNVDVNIPDQYGNIPLYNAVFNNELSIIKMLLSLSNINHVNNDGYNLRDIISKYYIDSSITKLIIENIKNRENALEQSKLTKLLKNGDL